MLEAKLDHPARSIGCEVEAFVPLIGTMNGLEAQRTIAEILTANGVRATHRTYSHDPIPAGVDVMVESDASVQGDSHLRGIRFAALEVKTRICTSLADFEQLIPKTLEVLRAMNCQVNATAGGHLHIGFTEVNRDPSVIRSMYNLIHRYEKLIFELVPPSRRNNQYCLRLPDVARALHGCQTLDCYEQSLGHLSRYQALNWTHLFKGRNARLEWRYAASSLNTRKVIHWARFCTQLMNHAAARNCQATPKQVEGNKAGLDKLLTSCGFRVNTKIYAKVCPELRETGRWLLLQRWKELHPDASKSTGNVAAASTSNESEV